MAKPGRLKLGVSLGAVLSGLSFGACGTSYTAAPTLCDDWCRATMRADCVGDKPDECVSDCLRERRPECETNERELIDCYAAAPDSSFRCEDGSWKSRPDAGVCQPEHEAVFACKEPVLSECLSSCAARVARSREAFDADGQGENATWACADAAPDCECACYTLYFLSATPDAAFFDCVERTARDVCGVEVGSPNPELSGESCRPPGIFGPCSDDVVAR